MSTTFADTVLLTCRHARLRLFAEDDRKRLRRRAHEDVRGADTLILKTSCNYDSIVVYWNQKADVDFESKEIIYLLAAFAKNEKENLSKAERNILTKKIDLLEHSI